MPGGYYPDTKISGKQSSNQAVVHADGSLLTTLVPEAYRFYFHTIFDTPGVVAANTFLSVFNPSGSGKTLVFFNAQISSYSLGATNSPNSMQAFRTSAASGGTQIATADVNRFLTTWPNPAAEVRVGNPTITTVGVPLDAWVPPISIGAGEGATSYATTPPGAGFVCLPGEGLAFGTAAGDTDQMWRVNTVWAEV